MCIGTNNHVFENKKKGKEKIHSQSYGKSQIKTK